jgi:hypothetical protein
MLLRAKQAMPPLTGHLSMGTGAGANRPVEVNSRFLRRDGRPWLPVTGEFHFSRYPEELWRREVLLMRAGGVDLVATYLFWNQHEAERGTRRFDGSLDVRRFVALCGELGLGVVVRLGPWSHGECRRGGFPDWLDEIDCVPRTDDPAYLAVVEPYYTAVAEQLDGLRWADGGPVVAVQVENELYDQPTHLSTLRAMAERAGLHVPLWTATGWGGADVPADVLLPLYGGYPEAFWQDASDGWAREMRRHYFPTHIRDDHSIGADLRLSAPSSPVPDDSRVPYATCELGGGMAIAYHRRPLVPADDVAALALTKLASGSVWQGYYVYHGCSQRLDLPAPNQESHATGYPNDLPAVTYDFQAPLGEYGQVRPSFAALRRQHLFVRDCGADLAVAPPHLPDVTPADLDDRDTLRWSVRTAGTSAFLFVNNHQPHEPLPDHHGVRFEVHVDDDVVRLPDVDIPSGAYFVWPIRYDLGGVALRWATAQPAGRLTVNGLPVAVFVATAGVPARFAFADGAAVTGADVTEYDGGIVATVSVPADLTVTAAGVPVRVLVLTEEDGPRLQRVELAGVDTLLLCDEPVVVDGDHVWVDTTADHVTIDFLPAPDGLDTEPRGPFWRWHRELTTTAPEPTVVTIAADAVTPPARTGGSQDRASAPLDDDFTHAATYHVTVPAEAFDGSEEVLLHVAYTGDVARAHVGGRLVADHFWYGPVWEIGLRVLAAEVVEHGLEIRVLPRPPESAVYVDPSVRERYDAAVGRATVDGTRLVPVQRCGFTAQTAKLD